jgi:hypothetical protein
MGLDLPDKMPLICLANVLTTHFLICSISLPGNMKSPGGDAQSNR